jgi:hypothetical protein
VRTHQSEAEIEHIEHDWTIHNDGSLEDLREAVGTSLQVALP